jgi:hypothetical protein
VLRTVAQLMIRKAAPQWLPRCLRLLRTAMTNIRMTRQAKNKLSSNNADANALTQRPRKFQRGAPATLTAGSRLFLQNRRSARRGDRHRHHHQQQAVHEGLQLADMAIQLKKRFYAAA